MTYRERHRNDIHIAINGIDIAINYIEHIYTYIGIETDDIEREI